MRRLSSLGSRQLAHRKGRSALTALGIVLGVAILFGVLISNATTQSGVDRLVEDFTGRADIVVDAPGAFDATLPTAVLARLARLPDVTDAVGLFGFRSSVPDAKGARIEIALRGIDPASARLIQNYPLVAGAFFSPGADEVLVPRRLLRKTGARAGDVIRVATPFGVRPMRITGELDDTGAGRTNQGDVLFTSITTARSLARRGDVISSARLVLRDGTDPGVWIARHEHDLGPGLDFQNAKELARGFQDFLGILGAIFTFFAAIVLFVGAFLIYLTLSMAVIERTRVYGTMRALGATRAQIRRVVITEALALGSGSTVIGLALGLAIAKGLLAMTSRLFELDTPGLTITPSAVLAGVGVGVVVTLVSSLVPARRAARLSPVVAMRGDYAADTKLSRAWIAGVLSAIGGITLGMTSANAALGTPLILLGSVLLVPTMLRPLARALGRVTNRLARGVGDVAVLHLVRERSRSAYTLALIMVVMAMIFSVGGMYASMAKALDDTLDRQFGADIHLDAAGTLDPSFETELRAVPGVGTFTAIRLARTRIEKAGGGFEETFVRIIDPDTYFDVESFQFVDGTQAQAKRALAGGDAILVPESTATKRHKRIGDTVRVMTARGPHDFRIAATYATFAGPPDVTIGLPAARRLLHAGGATAYHVNVARDADAVAVRRVIERTLGARYGLEVGTSGTDKAEARKQFGQFFNIFYAIILVATIVGLLGLANTLAMSVLQRYREIGVLRAIGTTRGQVRRMVLVESATLGLVAFALALPLGWLLSMLTVRSVSNAFGFTVSYIYPTAWIPAVALFGVVVAVIAALAPGRRAARLEVVSALQYE